MENNRFFIGIWRANSVLILVGILIILSTILYQFSKKIFRDHNPPQENIVRNIAEDPNDEEKWVLGHPTKLSGNDFIMIPLISKNKEVKVQSLGIISTSQTESAAAYRNRTSSKNILFINSESNESVWLFKDTHRLILNTQPFPQRYGPKEPTASLIFYDVVSNDSNNDKVLDYQDDYSLYVSNPRGENYQLVLKAYDRILSKNLVGENKILVVYQFKGIAHSMLLQIAPFKIISNKELPSIDNS